MSARIYNKFYVNTNRTEGSEKILLGYQQDTRDTLLKKDQETYFHIPAYTDPIYLFSSSLIADGATGGSFPAASDRIFKNRKNYGNVTANGDPSSLADGTWFCSWLYKDPSGVFKWMDRYYNPGKFVYSVASRQLSEGPTYIKNNPIFRDVPTTMVFDPGVMYRYFHAGESTNRDLVTTLGGISGERVLMNLTNWGTAAVDSSSYNQTVIIAGDATAEELYPTVESTDRVTNPVISFNNTKDVEVSVDFQDSFNPTTEFTLAFGAQSNSWLECPSTQLIGNMTSRGGFGLFLQSLSSFPFFVVPETGYGHLLYINEGSTGYQDKSVQLQPSVSSTPEFVAIDLDHNVFVANNDGTSGVTKYDSYGYVTAASHLANPYFAYSADEVPIQMLCGPSDTVSVITTSNIHTFDVHLNLIGSVPCTLSSTTIAAYQYSTTTGQAELLYTDGVNDVKYIEEQQWSLSATDGFLYRKNTSDAYPQLFAELSSAGTKLGIDPFNRIWVMHGTNFISVFDSSAPPLSKPLFQVSIGTNSSHSVKNLSFFCAFDRTTNTREWKAVVLHAEDANIYVLDMNGNLKQTISYNSLFNPSIVDALSQDSTLFQFIGKGDFTGYEHKRIFSKLPPYNDSPQLVFRATLKDKTKTSLSFKTLKTIVPISDWSSSGWQHFVITLKNRLFAVYVNGSEYLTLPYAGDLELSYELRPPLFIGTPGGSQIGFNRELHYPSSIFNGVYEDIKIYDYAIDPSKLELFAGASIIAENMYWSLPVPSVQYIEKIERTFKHKLPGAKSSFYNINISGAQITDLQTRAIVEEQVKRLVTELQPAYVDLLSVRWVD